MKLAFLLTCLAFYMTKEACLVDASVTLCGQIVDIDATLLYVLIRSICLKICHCARSLHLQLLKVETLVLCFNLFHRECPKTFQSLESEVGLLGSLETLRMYVHSLNDLYLCTLPECSKNTTRLFTFCVGMRGFKACRQKSGTCLHCRRCKF